VQLRGASAVPPIPVAATRVQLILKNLCTNAVKYSDRRQRERYIEIRVERTERPREWRIDIEDNGIGIPEQLQQHVFDESLRSPESAGEDGEGIGLSLAREAALQINGRLWFSSAESKGSTFSFTIEEPSERLEV
jgi:signal transduction histidine kinase